MDITSLIISKLLSDESYARKVIPNIKPEYFRSGTPERVSFEIIDSYVGKYNELPSLEAVAIELQNKSGLTEDLFRETAGFLRDVTEDKSEVQSRWLIDQTEQYCQDRAIHLAISKSLEILKDAGEKGLSKGSIPKLLQDALSVTFDPHIGHDYMEDAGERWETTHRKHRRLEFDLESFNEITQGGLLPKTLNVIMATSGAGKSLAMCHMAAANLTQGKNVLYVTLELSQEMVATRIDANLMGIDLDVLKGLPKSIFDKKIQSIREKTSGRLIVKEYSAASAAHIRHLLTELKTKKNFTPDIIYVDYLNICSVSGKTSDMNSYEKVKTIAEEIRAIAVDYEIPIVSATQGNRGSYGSTSVGMENVSDSMGLVFTADLIIALVQTEELERLGQYKVIQLKTRYGDIGKRRTFFIGVRKSQMRLFDLDRTTSRDEEEENDMGSLNPFGTTTPSFSGFS